MWHKIILCHVKALLLNLVNFEVFDWRLIDEKTKGNFRINTFCGL